MNEKHKKVGRAFDFIEHFLVFVSAVRGCISISAIVSVVGVPVGIASSVVRLKICNCRDCISQLSQKRWKVMIK